MPQGPSEFVQDTRSGYPDLEWGDLCFHIDPEEDLRAIIIPLRKGKVTKRVSIWKDNLMEGVADVALTMGLSPRLWTPTEGDYRLHSKWLFILASACGVIERPA